MSDVVSYTTTNNSDTVEVDVNRWEYAVRGSLYNEELFWSPFSKMFGEE